MWDSTGTLGSERDRLNVSFSSLSASVSGCRSPRVHLEVRLMIYDLHSANDRLHCCGIGVYHSAVRLTAVPPIRTHEDSCCSSDEDPITATVKHKSKHKKHRKPSERSHHHRTAMAANRRTEEENIEHSNPQSTAEMNVKSRKKRGDSRGELRISVPLTGDSEALTDKTEDQREYMSSDSLNLMSELSPGRDVPSLMNHPTLMTERMPSIAGEGPLPTEADDEDDDDENDNPPLLNPTESNNKFYGSDGVFSPIATPRRKASDASEWTENGPSARNTDDEVDNLDDEGGGDSRALARQRQHLVPSDDLIGSPLSPMNDDTSQSRMSRSPSKKDENHVKSKQKKSSMHSDEMEKLKSGDDGNVTAQQMTTKKSSSEVDSPIRRVESVPELDIEYAYGGNPWSSATGVFSNPPGLAPGLPRLRQSILVKSLKNDRHCHYYNNRRKLREKRKRRKHRRRQLKKNGDSAGIGGSRRMKATMKHRNHHRYYDELSQQSQGQSGYMGSSSQSSDSDSGDDDNDYSFSIVDCDRCKCCCFGCCGSNNGKSVAYNGGRVVISMKRLEKIIDSFRVHWSAQDYDCLTRNCNHFSTALVIALTGNAQAVPSWLNRIATLGRCFECCLPDSLRYPLKRAEAALFLAEQQSEEKKRVSSSVRSLAVASPERAPPIVFHQLSGASVALSHEDCCPSNRTVSLTVGIHSSLD